MHLSDMLLTPSASSHGQPQNDDFIFPVVDPPDERAEMAESNGRPPGLSTSMQSSASLTNLSPSTVLAPSNLSILLRRHDESPTRDHSSSPVTTTEPRIRRLPSVSESSIRFVPQPPNRASVYDALLAPSPSPSLRDRNWDRVYSAGEGENTPLLQTSLTTPLPSYTTQTNISELKSKSIPSRIARHAKEAMSKENMGYFVVTSLKSIPAVLLGTLLNVLDGVSCELLLSRSFISRPDSQSNII